MENKRNLRIRYLLFGLIGTAVLILLDQGTKALAVRYLAGTDGIDLISGVLCLQYLENRGMAFGMFQNKQTFFYIMTVVIVPVIVWIYCRLPRTKHYLPLHILSVVILAGALGNFIDRVRLKYVIDFIYFELIDFPIFNVADIFVTVGMAVLLILIFFVYKEEDFVFLEKKKKEGSRDA